MPRKKAEDKKISVGNDAPERLVVYAQIVKIRIALNLLSEVSCYIEDSELSVEDQCEAMYESRDNLEAILNSQLTYWNRLERSSA